MKKVILEGAFYSPNASEGRWAWNIARVLDKMAEQGLIELDLFLPPGASEQFFYSDSNAWKHFKSPIITKSDKEYDVLFLVQPGLTEDGGQYLNEDISARKRVHGQFELYWYGRGIGSRVLPENYEFCYAMEPYSDLPSNQNWPPTVTTGGKQRKIYHLPYSPNYEKGSNNFDNKRILLTIKSPIHADYTNEEVRARVDHFHVALHYLKQGIPVTVGYANRLYINMKEEFKDEFVKVMYELRDHGAAFVGNVSPLEMRELIKKHSIMYTGKVGNVILYASFMDALNYGSVPIIFTDWPEQFFYSKGLFTGYEGMGNLVARTEMLLNNEDHYQMMLETLRNNINLYSEEDMITKLKGIIGCQEPNQ